MATQTIHIAMFNADTPVPNVVPRWPTYGSIFTHLLKQAASRISPKIQIVSTEYDVVQGEYPSSLSDIDLILITGAAASAYDLDPWIKQLDSYVHDVYSTNPRVKIFGSCFGHQIVGQSLLRPYGIVAEKDPNGYEVGVKEITLADEFRVASERAFRESEFVKTNDVASSTSGDAAVPKNLKLQFIHGDHVKVVPVDSLPPNWYNIGSTEHCAVQGLYEPGRIFTLQGHFEFDRFVNGEVLRHFASQGWPVEEYFETVEKDDDSGVMAELVVKFLVEDRVGEKDGGAIGRTGGLLTPPLSR